PRTACRSVTGCASAIGSGACQALSTAVAAPALPAPASATYASTTSRIRRILDSEQWVQPVAQRQARLGLEPARELIRPATPHEVELDERAVLVEDDEVDPVEEVPRLEGAA